MHDLLREPVIPVEGADAPALSLPAVLAALSAGREISFPGLAAHQRQAWFCFLVQLGAMALVRAASTDAPDDEAAWRDLIAALAGDDADTAFALIVDDISRPAFLQSPIRSPQAWEKFRGPIDEPDAIDILIVAKNHEVKSERIAFAAPHHWVYALLTLQTQQGFLGRGNYGIARMNGGFSSRAFVDRMAGPGWAARFRRDLALLVKQHASSRKWNEHYYKGDIGLLWLEPWDEEKSLSLEQLDPYFIEICRRVRLVTHDGKTGAMLRPSETARISAAAAKGVLGDPWAPVDTEAGTAFTIGSAGFDYRRIVQILTDRAGLPMSMQRDADDDDPDRELDIQFSVLVRGQGRTDGLHERVISVSHSLANRLSDEDMSERLKRRSGRMLEDVGKSASPALRTGLRAYLQGAPADIDFKDERVGPISQAFDRDVDAGFLDWLWKQADADDGDAVEADWQSWLAQTAQARFRQGLEQLPVPSQRREKARVAAENLFYSMIRKNLPKASLKQASHKQSNDEEETAA